MDERGQDVRKRQTPLCQAGTKAVWPHVSLYLNANVAFLRLGRGTILALSSPCD